MCISENRHKCYDCFCDKSHKIALGLLKQGRSYEYCVNNGVTIHEFLT